jgi:hypothetical protein
MCNNYKLITQQLTVIPELIGVEEQTVDVFSSSDSPFSMDTLLQPWILLNHGFPWMCPFKPRQTLLYLSSFY